MTTAASRKMKYRVKHGIFVEKSPQEVFDYVADVDNSPQWQSTLFDIRDKKDVKDGRLQPRARVKDARNILGNKIEAEWQVVDYQPGQSITMELAEGSPVYWKMKFSVEAVDGGTFLTGEGGGDLGNIALSPAAFSRSCQTMLQNDLATLRDVLERRN